MERNTLNQAKKIVKEVKKVSPNIKITFFEYFYSKRVERK